MLIHLAVVLVNIKHGIRIRCRGNSKPHDDSTFIISPSIKNKGEVRND